MLKTSSEARYRYSKNEEADVIHRHRHHGSGWNGEDPGPNDIASDSPANCTCALGGADANQLQICRIAGEHELGLPRIRVSGAMTGDARRIEDVAQGIAQQVGAEHREADGDTGEDHEPRRRADILRRRFRQHAAPGRIGFRHAKAEEGE